MQMVLVLELSEHLDALHVGPILVDVMAHEVRAIHEDGVRQALAEIDPPPGEQGVRAGNLHSEALYAYHDGNRPSLVAFRLPFRRWNLLCGGKRLEDFVHATGVSLLLGLSAYSIGLIHELLLSRVTIHAVSEVLLRAVMDT